MTNERTVSAEEARGLIDGTTPGPWGFERVANEATHPCMIFGGECENEIVADIEAASDGTDMLNARLIAAAPDLARTVEALHARVAELTERCERAEHTRDAARAALRAYALHCDICGDVATRERFRAATGRVCDSDACASAFGAASWSSLRHAAALRALVEVPR